MEWSRPSTPHRRSASVNSTNHYEIDPSFLPLDSLLGPKAIVELSDSMATFDMNMQHLLAVHNSLASFNESFASFFHSMKMNAWCVEFSEAPTTESLKYDRSEFEVDDKENNLPNMKANNLDGTYMTDTSFVEEPVQTPPVRPVPSVSSSSVTSLRTIGSANSASSGSSRGSRIPQPASRFERPTSASVRNTVGSAKNSQQRTPSTLTGATGATSSIVRSGPPGQSIRRPTHNSTRHIRAPTKRTVTR